MAADAADAPEERRRDDVKGDDQAGSEKDAIKALDLARGEVNDDDLAELEAAVDGIDFAARKAAPDCMARLRALHARLGDLIEQVEKGVRKRSERPPIAAADEERYKALVEEGVALGEATKLPEALEKLEAALRLDPEGIEALFNLGVLYGLLAHANIAKGEFYDSHVRDEVWTEKAVFCYERALELDPENVHALNNVATLYALRDERDLAIETLKRSLALAPEQADVKRHLEELESAT